MRHRDVSIPPAPQKQHSSDDDAAAATAISRAKKKSRYPVDDDEDGGEGGDRVECSGKYCRSCGAGMIGDCVALCCCPCVVVNLLTLALVKVPWTIGRRCLKLAKKKKKNSQGQNRKSTILCKSDRKMIKHCVSNSSNSKGERWFTEEEELPAEVSGYVIEFYDGEEEEEDCVSSAERVWLELYQFGHLGFGRVSFSGGLVHPVQGKGSLGT